MSEFIRIGDVGELPPPGQARQFRCGAAELCVANLDGKYHAIDNVCPHRGGPLAEGVIEGSKIVCPWHGWEFELATGRSSFGGDIAVAAYELKIDGDAVFARLREA